MDEVEENPFYRMLMTKFRAEFDIACKMSYVIAVPRTDSLEELDIDRYFAKTHILVPSKLLRQHYTPLQIGYFEDIEVDNKRLVCHVGKSRPIDKVVVNIVREELGYSSSPGGQFRMLVLDRPLLSFSARPLLQGLLRPRLKNSQSRQLLTRQQRARGLTHHDDCSRYLECISSNMTSLLEEEVRRIQSNYVILSNYLGDAAARTRHLAEGFIANFEIVLEENGLHLNGAVSDLIRLAVENYIVHLLHGKLIVALHELYAKEDKLLMAKFELVRRNGGDSVSQLGAQDTFSEFNVSVQLAETLEGLPSAQSPITMVAYILKSFNIITELLNQSAQFKRLVEANGREPERRARAGDADQQAALVASQPRLSPKVITVCSDDLIASLIFSLARVKPQNLFSAMKYLETFGSDSAAKDQAAYYTATFQIVVQYIFNFDGTNRVQPPERPKADRPARSRRRSTGDQRSRPTSRGRANTTIPLDRYFI